MKWISLSAFLLLFAVSASAPARAAGDTLFGQPAQPVERPITPGTVVLNAREIDALILPRSGAPLSFPSIDRFVGNESAPLEFRPIDLFADGSRIVEMAAGTPREKQRPARQYYLASNRSAGIGLAVDPVTGTVSGFVSKGGGRLEISGDFVSGLQFAEIAEAEEGANSCGNGEHDLSLGAPAIESIPQAMSASASEAGSVISYQAVVAVETDSEWLDGFGDDTGEALAWITDVFLAVNVFYERDVETRLLIGDVILRTGSDPYNPSTDTFAKLNEFGEYWMENMDGVDRQFAAMFSGRNISAWGFSGIAWINQYCDYGRSVNGGTAVAGSYSYNAIGSSRTAANTALFVGHELGHNLGSPHTHCYSPAVDQCYNAESGCYSGPTQCPAGGQGTIMSYCHVGGSNGAGCGSSKSEFHPTVQTRLESRLASQLVAGCIMPYTEVNPTPEFQSAPVAGALVDFGDQAVGATSPAEPVQVQNIGDANLTLSCTLSGPGQAAFDVATCAPSVAPSASANVQLTCTPASSGAHQAVLTLLTNDPDEAAVDYSLSCNGQAAPGAEMISQSSFES